METSLGKACERLESGDDTLRELKLERVDPRFIRALSRPSCIDSLVLREVEMSQDLAGALAQQTQLTKLELVNPYLGDGAASHLAAALPEMASLETMELWKGSDDDVKPLLAAVGKPPRLQTLVLGGLELEEDLMPLVEGLQASQSIVHLSLRYAVTDAACMATLAEAVVRYERLRVLTVSWSSIEGDGAAHLAAMLERNRSLTKMDLDGCRIGDAGLVRLGRALTHNTTLRALAVGANNFSYEGIEGFAHLMGDMHGLQRLEVAARWEEWLLPGIERNYSLLQLPFINAAQPLLERNARGYAKARAATLAWLCACRFHAPNGITRDVARIIARLVYASRGQRCWTS